MCAKRKNGSHFKKFWYIRADCRPCGCLAIIRSRFPSLRAVWNGRPPRARRQARWTAIAAPWRMRPSPPPERPSWSLPGRRRYMCSPLNRTKCKWTRIALSKYQTWVPKPSSLALPFGKIIRLWHTVFSLFTVKPTLSLYVLLLLIFFTKLTFSRLGFLFFVFHCNIFGSDLTFLLWERRVLILYSSVVEFVRTKRSH